jgi:hypothetical protein
VVSDDVACCGVVVFEFSVVIESEKKMIGQILDAKRMR